MTALALSPSAGRWLADGEHGISSEAIFNFLLFGVASNRWWSDHPSDPDDFRRCELLLRAVPELRPRLPEMAARSEVWARLVDRWYEIAALIEEDVPGVFDGGHVHGSSRRGYDLMTELIRPSASPDPQP